MLSPSPAQRLAAWWVLVAGGLGLLIASGVGPLPGYVGELGTVAVTAAYAWALAARTGGRSLVFGVAAAVIGLVAVVIGSELLRTGAAVATCALSAVLGVMATVPARRFLHAVREVVVALAVAGAGTVAAVGYAPTISLVRFEYTTLLISFAGVLALVYRLGAGLHGLGRRGIVGAFAAVLVLVLILVYGEALESYSDSAVLEWWKDFRAWLENTLGAVPRPIQAVLGIPALAWGVYMRARRRQGWWLCAFGVAATAPVANSVMNPNATLTEAGLGLAYSLAVGLILAYVVIRIDLLLTGSRGSRARRDEERGAVRPEPSRTRPLL